MESLQKLTCRALRREQGQTMAEYTIVLAVIITGIVLTLSTLGAMIGDHIQSIAEPDSRR